MKTIFLIFLSLFLGFNSFGQSEERFNENLDKLYPEGHKVLLDIIYRNIKYPLAARENCRVGTLKTLISIDTTGAIKSVTLVNGLGMGINEEVIRVLKLTSGNWLQGKSFKYPINFAFRIGKNQKDILGDVVVTALTSSGPDAGCGVSVATIEKNIKKYQKKGKLGLAKLLYEELLRRYPDHPTYRKAYYDLVKKI